MPDEREARHLAELLKAQGIMADVLEVPNDPPRPARDGETDARRLAEKIVEMVLGACDAHGPIAPEYAVRLVTPILTEAMHPSARDGETLSGAGAIDGELLDTAECSAYPNRGRCTHTRCLLRERNALSASVAALRAELAELTCRVRDERYDAYFAGFSDALPLPSNGVARDAAFAREQARKYCGTVARAASGKDASHV